jgi:hypothetical protein
MRQGNNLFLEWSGMSHPTPEEECTDFVLQAVGKSSSTRGGSSVNLTKIYLLEGLCSQTASGNIACPPTFNTTKQTPNTLVLVDLKDDIVIFFRRLKKNLCRPCEIDKKRTACSLLRPPCIQHRGVCSDWCLYYQGWLRGTKFLKLRRHAQNLRCLQRLGQCILLGVEVRPNPPDRGTWLGGISGSWRDTSYGTLQGLAHSDSQTEQLWYRVIW